MANSDKGEVVIYLLFTVLYAYVCYLHFQLRGFEIKFEEINSNIDYLEMLKQIKAAVPEIQQEISSLNEQTGTALIWVKELVDRTNLAGKRLNDTEAVIALATDYMRNIEMNSKDISKSNDKLKSELENESKNIESLKKKIEGLELESIQKQISELKERTDDAESVLIPSIEKQKALVNSIKEFEDISKRVSTIKDELSIAEQKMTKLKEYNNSIQSLSVMIEKGENFTKQFIEQTLTGLIARVESHIRNASTPWISVIGIIDILLIAVLFYLWLKPEHKPRYMQLARGNSTTRSEAHNERPQSILEYIYRVPVLDSKICVLSFYAETQPLHKALMNSALESCRRGNTLEVVVHLARTHGDILNIPKARFIYIFVDFNERNVILENPDQNVGSKKLLSVQACQKMGADVCVIYVRDKGSLNLFPGHLYNHNISAFTDHQTLRQLEAYQRCFSVYEQFNTTQREHIARIIG